MSPSWRKKKLGTWFNIETRRAGCTWQLSRFKIQICSISPPSLPTSKP